MSSKSIIGIIIVALIVIVGGYFIFSGGQSQKTIQIAGSTSVQPVAEALAQNFTSENPAVKINVQGGGTAVGIKSVQDGTANIGTASKKLKPDEATGLQQYMIGKDGIVVAVNTKNSVSDLTTAQIKGIFSGFITNWSEVGGSNASIHVIIRESGSGTRDAFSELVMGGKNATYVKSAIIQSSTESIKQAVIGDPYAIGFISLADMSSSVKALSVNGVTPSESTVADGTYTIQRPFLFLTKGQPTGEVKKFINWVLSPQGQAIVKQKGVVPVNATS
jgi:phosphate transport system substrate-binding protein